MEGQYQQSKHFWPWKAGKWPTLLGENNPSNLQFSKVSTYIDPVDLFFVYYMANYKTQTVLIFRNFLRKQNKPIADTEIYFDDETTSS